MLVVSDTSPVNYLVLIGIEEVLPTLYGSILMPSQVLAELTRARAPESVRNWGEHLPAWVQIHEGDPSRYPDLGIGEAAAIALALDFEADALLVDDAEARSIARSSGVQLIGTLGVLAEAHNSGLVDFDQSILRLRTTSFRVHESVVAHIRQRLS